MYFNYPPWSGSMPDPSMAPPPPVIFKTYYFNSGKPPHSHADDDSGVHYGADYGRPPPSNPPKKDPFGYWTYTRVYNARPAPFTNTFEIPPFPRPRPFAYPAYPSFIPPQPNPHSHAQSPPPRTRQRRPSRSVPEATKAWRARQEKLWEEFERETKGAPEPESTRNRWEYWVPPQKSNKRAEASSSAWGEEWTPPRAPSPTKSDGGPRRDGERYAGGYGYTRGPNGERVPWSWHHWPPNAASRPATAPPPSEAKLAEAFALYCKSWATLLTSDDAAYLTFRNIPWPQYPSPRCVEDIKMQDVRAFLGASGRPLKVRRIIYSLIDLWMMLTDNADRSVYAKHCSGSTPTRPPCCWHMFWKRTRRTLQRGARR